MVVTVLANTLDAQGVLLQVVEILWGWHLEIVYAGVRELPACTQNTRVAETHRQFQPEKVC